MTKLSLVLENHALGTILDRFSTSSTTKLSGRFVPENLEGLYLPQVLLSKFQRVFFEDLPQIIIQFIFFLTYGTFSGFSMIKTVTTTIVNFINTMNDAWIAKPS